MTRSRSSDARPTVSIVGLGYVGLTLAVVMAERGFHVTGVEIDDSILRALTQGRPHFHEVGLSVRLESVLRRGNLRIVERLAGGAEATDVYVISVGTPLGPDGKPRVDMVERVTREIAEVMPMDALVVLRSTVVIGTTRGRVLPLLRGSGKRFRLAYCPERTIEGRALEELRTLPQIVGGADDEAARDAATLFQELTPTIIRVATLETAEVIKLLDNSYRDLCFAFGNEVALLCDAIGIDGVEVINAANTGYPRTSIAPPGLVGGPCLEKDPHILSHSLRPFGFSPKLIETGRRLNEELPGYVVESALVELEALGGHERPIVAVCGVAFKGRPETDDVRGTPSRLLIAELRRRFPDSEIRAHDFAVPAHVIARMGVRPVSIEDAFEGANLVFVANNNARYQWLDFHALFGRMATPAVVYDIWDVLRGAAENAPHGVAYRRLGSATSSRDRHDDAHATDPRHRWDRVHREQPRPELDQTWH
jgi:nucleotide sugar dehydrogenase